MRVIILAATPQKAAVADSLIQHDGLSKIVLHVSSGKLVNQAQALIIYYECMDDLVKLRKLLKIYSGCPLKIYFGFKRYQNFQHYYSLQDSDKLVNEIFQKFTELGESADTLYEMVLKKEEGEDQVVSVQSMVSEIRQKDVIEEQCVELFTKKDKKAQKKKQQQVDATQKVLVPKDRFRSWWSEGKLNSFEMIKYYLIGWMAKEMSSKKLDAKAIQAIKEFRSYFKKRKEIKIMKNHYDNNFTLKIEGSEKGQELPSVKAKLITALPGLKKEGLKLPGLPATVIEESKQMESATGTVPRVMQKIDPGTTLSLKVTVFPDQNDSTLLYLQNLHQFDEENWFSLGFKPKAKDLKTFIEDLQNFDYLNNIDDVETNLVLDGRKVRIGCESYKFDILDENEEKNEETIALIDSLMVKDDGVVQQAEFELNASLGSKLSEILVSQDPVIVSIFKSLNISSSLKFHLKQFSKVLTNTTKKEFKEYVEVPEDKAGKSKKKNEQGAEEEKEKSQQDEDEEQEDENEEEEEDDGYGDEDDEYGSDDDESQVGRSGKKGRHSDQFNLKEALKNFLPFFLFKWNANIDMQPDLEDIREHCRDHKQESFILKNYQELVYQFKGINLKDKNPVSTSSQSTTATASVAKAAKRGGKAELLNYLIAEVGDQVEFAWRSRYFFISGELKTEELGDVINLLNKGEFI